MYFNPNFNDYFDGNSTEILMGMLMRILMEILEGTLIGIYLEILMGILMGILMVIWRIILNGPGWEFFMELLMVDSIWYNYP